MLYIPAKAQIIKGSVIRWTKGDSIARTPFPEERSIRKWIAADNKNAVVEVENFKIAGKAYSLYTHVICSGVYCPSVYVFKQDQAGWRLLCYSLFTLRSEFVVEHPENSEELIFKSGTETISRLDVKE